MAYAEPMNFQKGVTAFLFMLSSLMATACSVPVSVNLLEVFPDAATGTVGLSTPEAKTDLLAEIAQPAGTIGVPLSSPIPISGLSFPELVVSLPLTLAEDDITAEVLGATLRYEVDLAAVGPLSGTLVVQPYLAPGGAANPASSAYALGSSQRVFLDASGTTFQGEVELNAAQLAALNARALQLGLGLAGENIVLGAGGQPGISYVVRDLVFEVTRVASEVDMTVPDTDGERLDFSDQSVDRVGNLGIAYRVVLTPPANVRGTLQAQVYIAPPLAPGQTDATHPLYSDEYAFGNQQTVTLDGREVVLEDRAALGSVEDEILAARQLRVGVRVTGQAEVPLGEELELSYTFTRLVLSGGYALF